MYKQTPYLNVITPMRNINLIRLSDETCFSLMGSDETAP